MLAAVIVTLRLRVSHVRSAVMIFVGIVISADYHAASRATNLELPAAAPVTAVITAVKIAARDVAKTNVVS